MVSFLPHTGQTNFSSAESGFLGATMVLVQGKLLLLTTSFKFMLLSSEKLPIVSLSVILTDEKYEIFLLKTDPKVITIY